VRKHGHPALAAAAHNHLLGAHCVPVGGPESDHLGHTAAVTLGFRLEAQRDMVEMLTSRACTRCAEASTRAKPSDTSSPAAMAFPQRTRRIG
jgi:hypothetical protein